MALTIEDVAGAIADWPNQAKSVGVTKGSAKIVGDAHARVSSDFGAS